MGYTKVEPIPRRIEVNIVGEDEILDMLYEHIKREKKRFARSLDNELVLPDRSKLRLDCCIQNQITVSWSAEE